MLEGPIACKLCLVLILAQKNAYLSLNVGRCSEALVILATDRGHRLLVSRTRQGGFVFMCVVDYAVLDLAWFIISPWQHSHLHGSVSNSLSSDVL